MSTSQILLVILVVVLLLSTVFALIIFSVFRHFGHSDSEGSILLWRPRRQLSKEDKEHIQRETIKYRDRIDPLDLEAIFRIIAERLGIWPVQRVRLESRFIDDFNTDSMDTVELIMEFEDQLGIVIPDEHAEKIHSIEDLLEYVASTKPLALSGTADGQN